MADYNEDGTPVETPDAPTGDTPAQPDTGVSPDVVTIVAPLAPSLMGLLLLIGAVWYFSAHSKEYLSDED